MILPERAYFTNLNCNLHYTPDSNGCQGKFYSEAEKVRDFRSFTNF